MHAARELLRPARPLTRALRRRRRRTHADQRGAALVEALIVLPVLGIALAAVPMLFERYAAHQQALLAARRCAWAAALSGCSDVPADCDAQRTSAPNPTGEQDVVASARVQASAGAAVFDEVPVLGQALDALLGEAIQVHAVIQLPVYARRSESVSGHFAVACNEQPRDVLELARHVLCEHLPVLGCGDSP